MTDTNGERADETLRAIVLGSSEALALVDESGTVVIANGPMERMFHGATPGLVGRVWRDVITVHQHLPVKDQQEADLSQRFVAEVACGSGAAKTLARIQELPNGMALIGLECPECTLGGLGANPLPELTELSSQLVIQALHYQDLYATTDKQARTDALTGLCNRKAVSESYAAAAQDEVVRSRPASLLMVDVDHFKRLNDTRGHLTGDEALKNLGRLLKSVCRSTDTVARFGGEEFSILMLGADAEIAVHLAERVRSAVEAAQLCVDKVTVSIGVADCIVSEEPLQSLIARADAALYESKRGGRNRVTLSVPLADFASEGAA